MISREMMSTETKANKCFEFAPPFICRITAAFLKSALCEGGGGGWEQVGCKAKQRLIVCRRGPGAGGD